jgi:hypothetical protein
MGFPRADSELAVWLKTFAATFATHAATLGFTAAEVTAVENDAAMFDYMVSDLIPATKGLAQSRIAYKDLIKKGPIGATGGEIPLAQPLKTLPATVEPGIIPRLQQLIRRIKAAPNYTEAIGQSLDIIDSEGNSSDDETTAKPTLKGTAQPSSEVRIDFNKGSFDGVRIECRRGGSPQWELLGFDAYSPYTDSRPPLEAGKAEVREYRARYVKRDEPGGEWSDIISVSTKP